MAHGGKREAGPGKKIGRPAKPKIELTASKGIATEVLAMDRPPRHVLKCKCDYCKGAKKCSCETIEGNFIQCDECKTRAEHKVCHCEICRWWSHRLSRDARIRYDADVYLTNRRDGKPAQGVFIGDTRESARELDFGDLPELITPSQSVAPRRPN